ncbi:hypothetical protein PVV25_09460, partial [Salmonella enterica subsp. enterica serovar Typhimurium]|uniref:hypothetical protein n=1 Tax=Salmonella enterica TaxID=28901 RepID=UPI002FF937CC
ISMTKADLRLAVQRLISSSIVMLMSVISTHYDLSRISVGHYRTFLIHTFLLINWDIGNERLQHASPLLSK